MDFTVSNKTLSYLEEIIHDINLELLKEVHKKYLNDLNFSELEAILENKKKKKFIVKKLLKEKKEK